MSEREAAEWLEQYVKGISDPESPEFGKLLSPDELSRRFRDVARPAPTAGDVPPLAHVAKDTDPGVASLRSHAYEGDGDDVSAHDDVPCAARVAVLPPLGVSPAEVAEIYEMPDDLDGTGEVIGVLNAACVPIASIRADLEAFWKAFGIPPADIAEVSLGDPPARVDPVARFDLTGILAWAHAMAPGAKLVSYNVNSTERPDPWAEMIRAAVEGQGGATILTSSFTTPEQLYCRECPAAEISLLLQKAAALGISVVAATGDWGVFGGIPSTSYDNAQICGAPWPSPVFPAGNPWVLAVGGTMLLSRVPLTEVAWSGPLPPDALIRRRMALTKFAGSGGFSGQWAIPEWQNRVLRPGQQARTFPRSPNEPAVVPNGRGYPDVSLMAVGPSVQREAETELSATGYKLVMDGEWVDYAGGTSLGSPIWGAILARLNQALVSHRKPRLGFVTPRLYDLDARYGGAGPNAPFRRVAVGRTDVEFRVADSAGTLTKHELAGYTAASTWNPATGLGVPRVKRLCELILANAAPPSGTQ
jgi:subtilase family serine protease